MTKATRNMSNQLQARAWASYGSNNVANVRLPPKLRCSICNKHKNTEPNFSSKQLAGLKDVIQRKGQGAAQTHEMVCIPCSTAGISFEMTCIDCEQTMGLDAFAKTQRRDRDNAKCKKCSAKRVGRAPMIHASKDKSQDDMGNQAEYSHIEDDDDESEVGSSFDDSSSVTDSMSSVSLNSTESSDYSLTTSMNTTDNSEGGVRVLESDYDDWLDKNELLKRTRRTGSTYTTSLASTTGSVYGTGIISRTANASSMTRTEILTARQGPQPKTFARARPPPSVAGSTGSAVTADTETGSRARFNFPKVLTDTHAASIQDDDDSDSDGEWSKDTVHAPADDDSDDDSDGENFYS